jgi:hypothetical protein
MNTEPLIAPELDRAIGFLAECAYEVVGDIAKAQDERDREAILGVGETMIRCIRDSMRHLCRYSEDRREREEAQLHQVWPADGTLVGLDPGHDAQCLSCARRGLDCRNGALWETDGGEAVVKCANLMALQQARNPRGGDMTTPTQPNLTAEREAKLLCETCKARPGKPRRDNGLPAGVHCDKCWKEMTHACRQRSW